MEPGLDLRLTLFKPVGPLFKPVGPTGLKRAPIGLKRALRCARASHQLLPLFKPIGVYPLLAVGGIGLKRAPIGLNKDIEVHFEWIRPLAPL